MDPIRPTDREPTAAELEAFLEDEELRVALEPEVPEDVKEEILQNVERRHKADIEDEQADGAGASTEV